MELAEDIKTMTTTTKNLEKLVDKFESMDARVSILDDEVGVVSERLDDFNDDIRRDLMNDIDSLRRDVESQFKDVSTDQVRQDSELGQAVAEIYRSLEGKADELYRSIDFLDRKVSSTQTMFKWLAGFNCVVGLVIVGLACVKVFM